MCKLICMSFDGEYKKESPSFETIENAWEYSNDLGSKWFFYPFHFVVTESGKTIVDYPDSPFEWTKGKRVNTVAKIFENHSKKEETTDMDCEEFAWSM